MQQHNSPGSGHNLRLFKPEADQADNGGMDQPPTPRKRRKKRLPNFLRKPEQVKLLAVCAEQITICQGKRTKGRARAPTRLNAARMDQLLVLLGIRCGLRVSEMLNLDVEHLDFAGGMLFVNQGKGDKDRMVPLTDDLIALLQTWLGDRKAGAVFTSSRGNGIRLTTQTVEDRMARLGKIAGLQKKLKPHTIRHTAAVRWIETGAHIAEVKEFLGHESISSTDTYLHAVPEHLRAASNRAARD